jgi:hypothetical protein
VLKLSAIAQELALENLTWELSLSETPDMCWAYVSDLLSDVMNHARCGGVLVTVQVHLNVVAVAVHANLTAVIFVNGRKPDEATRARAVQEKIVLLSSRESAFDVAGKLYALGLRGNSPCA